MWKLRFRAAFRERASHQAWGSSSSNQPRIKVHPARTGARVYIPYC